MAARLIAGLLVLLVGLATGKASSAPGERQAYVRWLQGVAASHQLLGIPPRYAADTDLPIQFPAHRLVSINPNNYGQPHRLTPATARRLSALFDAAERDGIDLILASGFRSVIYQSNLIQRRLDGGRSLERTLLGTALPGYSEHHTGCAVDIVSSQYPRIGVSFRETKAYFWLQRNAADHGFRESYPNGNGVGLIAEPWHWFFEDCVTPDW